MKKERTFSIVKKMSQERPYSSYAERNAAAYYANCKVPFYQTCETERSRGFDGNHKFVSETPTNDKCTDHKDYR